MSLLPGLGGESKTGEELSYVPCCGILSAEQTEARMTHRLHSNGDEADRTWELRSDIWDF